MKPELLPDHPARRAASPADGETALRGGPRAFDGNPLPVRRPDSIWGGPGAGGRCTICAAPLSDDEMELEVEFAREDGFGTDRYHVHVRCFAEWEAELRKAEAAGSRPALPGADERSQNNVRDEFSFRRGRP